MKRIRKGTRKVAEREAVQSDEEAAALRDDDDEDVRPSIRNKKKRTSAGRGDAGQHPGNPYFLGTAFSKSPRTGFCMKANAMIHKLPLWSDCAAGIEYGLSLHATCPAGEAGPSDAQPQAGPAQATADELAHLIRQVSRISATMSFNRRMPSDFINHLL